MAVVVTLQPEVAAEDKDAVLKELDDEVESFSQFMGTLGDWRSSGPLSRPEKALIKTYLVHKVRGRI